MVRKNTLIITPIYDGDDKIVEMEVIFSPALVTLLQMEKDRFKHKRENKEKTIEVDIKKPDEIVDDSILLFTPDTLGEILIKINDNLLIKIPRIYCTIKTFNKIAFN